MTQSSLHATKFYKDVATNRRLWTIRDKGGIPAPKTLEGKRTMPFWSSVKRVEEIIQEVPAYGGFKPYEVTWEDFVDKWIPGMTKDGLLVGINWSGKRATGYDLEPVEVKRNVEASIQRFSASK